jgi:hypothetical protein
MLSQSSSLVKSLNFRGSNSIQSRSPILVFGDSNNTVYSIGMTSDQQPLNGNERISHVRYENSDFGIGGLSHQIKRLRGAEVLYCNK